MKSVEHVVLTACCLLAWLAASSRAEAETIHVPEGGDIIKAINLSSDGDVIQLEAGLYEPYATIKTIGRAITIRGVVDSTGGPASIVSGRNQRRVFECSDGEGRDTRFENLIITNGRAAEAGGMYLDLVFEPSGPVISNCLFEGNSASDYSGQGGAMCILGGDVLITGSAFVDNAATGSFGRGGAIHASRGRLEMQGVTLEGNTANSSGAIECFDQDLRFEDCVFRDNTATWVGAMDLNPYFDDSMSFHRCEFSGNRSTSSNSQGGGIYISADDEVVFEECVFTGNSVGSASGGQGGGVCIYAYHQSDEVVFLGCRFASNAATLGGGICHIGAGRTIIVDCEIETNLAAELGGGVYIEDGEAVISNTLLCGNTPNQIYGTWVNQGGNEILVECPCADADGDGTCDEFDQCPGEADVDTDSDGVADCVDQCTGVPDVDTDGDGTADCVDGCPDDPEKIDPQQCGCGVAEEDLDGDGISDCLDPCPLWPHDCSPDGATLFVTPGQPLQEAVDLVADGGTVQLRPGVFHQAIDLGARDILLRGDPEHPDEYVLDGSSVETSLAIVAGGETGGVVISGITFRHGRMGAPSGLVAGSRAGGAIHVSNAGNPKILDCIFLGNAADRGGAIYASDASPRIRRCRFDGNEAAISGGSIFVESSASLVITDCTFEADSAASQGGSIYLKDVAGQIKTSVVEQAMAEDRGGGVKFAGACSVALESSTITSNMAAARGGGLQINGNSSVSLEDCSVYGNIPDDVDGEFEDRGGNRIGGDGPPACPADLDGDGVVGGGDLGLLFVDWGEEGPADLDGDGIVGGADLGLLFVAWGGCP